LLELVQDGVHCLVDGDHACILPHSPEEEVAPIPIHRGNTHLTPVISTHKRRLGLPSISLCIVASRRRTSVS